MNKIYLTSDGLEGYNEERSDYSYTEHATLKDIEKLIFDLNAQVKNLEELHFLSEEYTEHTLGYWNTLLSDVFYRKDRAEASRKYEDNPTIQGTYYRECFETRAIDEKELIEVEKAYSMVPPRARKYLEHQHTLDYN